jgi:hypothetical protein
MKHTNNKRRYENNGGYSQKPNEATVEGLL